MISNSFKPMDQLTDPSIVWIPKNFTLDNFHKAAEAMHYWRSFFTSVRVGLISALIQVLTCSFIAYGFTRYRFKGRNLLFGLVIVTIIVPPQATMVPTYLNFTNVDFLGIVSLFREISGSNFKINLIDSAATFYIPSLFGVGLRSGLFIFIYRQFFKGLPRELEEAAWIDGAGHLRTYAVIALPLTGSAVLTVLIFSIMWHWNDYFLSNMYFSENFPLSVALAQIRSGLSSSMGYSEFSSPVAIRSILMAGCLVFILPMLLLYIFLQKYFIKSIERVGIVG